MTGRIPVDFQRWILDHPALNLGITSVDTIKHQEQECPARKRGRKSPVLWNPNRPTTHVSCLYPELLSMIFQYLDVPEKGRVAQVCTSWREAAYLRSVWRGVQAKLHLKKSSNSDVLRSLVRRGITKIQILSLQKNLKEVTSSVRNLESLLLTGCFNLSDDRLISAFNCRELSSLTHLDLSMCKKITDDSVSKIAQSLVNLEQLDLAGCANISNSSLAHIERGLRRLRWLNLRSCRNITDSGIARLCGQTAEENKLMEAGGIGEKQSENGRWRGVQSLRFLSLQDCQKLTDDSLKYISAGLKNLTSINLSFCASLTEFGMKHLSTMVGDSLREINLRSCDVTDLALRYLSEGGLTLHVLDISFCDRVRDDGLAYLSQGLPQLRSLSLNSIPCTDSGLVKLSQTLTDLNTLNVGQCFNITDRGIDAILNNCPHLSNLDIYGCSRISNQMIHRLEQLNLTLTRDLWQVGTESKTSKQETSKQVQPQIQQFTYLTNLNEFTFHPSLVML